MTEEFKLLSQSEKESGKRFYTTEIGMVSTNIGNKEKLFTGLDLRLFILFVINRLYF